MISVHVVGGLGNQLFQLFAGAALALNTNRSICMSFHDHKRQNFNGSFYTVKEQPPVRFSDYKEADIFAYKPLPQSGNVRLHGYYQNLRYFDGRLDDIVRLLQIRHDTNVTYPGTVIHVRRTDYTTLQHLYVQLDDAYYLPSLQDLPAPYTIVTDDPNDPYVNKLSAHLHAAVRSTNTVDDFWFLSAFDNIVCANSSFSVMAAVFARRRNAGVNIRVPPKFFHSGGAIKV